MHEHHMFHWIPGQIEFLFRWIPGQIEFLFRWIPDQFPMHRGTNSYLFTVNLTPVGIEKVQSERRRRISLAQAVHFIQWVIVFIERQLMSSTSPVLKHRSVSCKMQVGMS